MTATSACKIERNANHDRQPIRIVKGEAYAALTIYGNGWLVTGKGALAPIARRLEDMFKQALADGMTYAAALDYIEANILAA